jgi:hypothetical protein
MIKIKVFVLLGILLLGVPMKTSAQNTKIKTQIKADTSVFICVSPNAYAFHSSKNCRGIQRCTHEIKSTSKIDATKLGYKPCRICY